MSATKPKEALPAAIGDAESENIAADICVIGAGPGGLAVATAAAAFGRSVVLIERHKIGGDALNYGCVPSKAMAAVANRAHAMRSAGIFGMIGRDPEVDPRTVAAHVQSVVAGLEPNFSAERYVGLGVRVIRAAGRFINKKTVIAGEYRIKARRFVIATGSTPLVPAIPGLDSVPYFTNETIFDNQERLHSLIIIGGGANALELAQSHSRLGSRVMVLAPDKALPDEDPELARVVLDELSAEGIGVHEGAKVESVEGGLGRVRVNVSVGGEKHVVEGSHLLLCVGRKPAVSDLGLEAAGIRHDERGIKVGRGLKTSNRRVFAIGEAAGGAPYAQVADYHAGIVVRRALFHVPARVDARMIPRLTFTDPELAYVGLSEAEAVKHAGKINVLRWPYRENDRAQAERLTTGHVKVITGRDGKILGAGIAGAQAGELIQMWSLVISQGLNIKAMTGWVSPYPTLSEINKRAASSYFAAVPSSSRLRNVINFLAKFG
jgi:pyruvate/2-oxoglutarate dehydrogenase complex dihydrolipoamide dehydrogenase (E3) component